MSLANQHVNVAMMTSGGLAPCLSSSIAQLVHHWSKALSEGKISGLTFIMYIDGYKGVLTGDSFELPQDVWSKCDALNYLGGSPIGNSRVKVCAGCQDEKRTLLTTIL
jgi:pyrophosphate--fructose-6-phosphate 1-phosphotransferase